MKKASFCAYALLFFLAACGKSPDQTSSGVTFNDLVEHGAIVDANENLHSISCLRGMGSSQVADAISNQSCVVGNLKTAATDAKSLSASILYYYSYYIRPNYFYTPAAPATYLWNYLLGYTGDYYSAFGYTPTSYVYNAASACASCLYSAASLACLQASYCYSTPSNYTSYLYY